MKPPALKNVLVSVRKSDQVRVSAYYFFKKPLGLLTRLVAQYSPDTFVASISERVNARICSSLLPTLC